MIFHGAGMQRSWSHGFVLTLMIFIEFLTTCEHEAATGDGNVTTEYTRNDWIEGQGGFIL